MGAVEGKYKNQKRQASAAAQAPFSHAFGSNAEKLNKTRSATNYCSLNTVGGNFGHDWYLLYENATCQFFLGS